MAVMTGDRARGRSQRDQSFLLLFFKKEVLASLSGA
jgi:hypothetical protein